MREKHLGVINSEFENLCKLNKYGITLKSLPGNTFVIVIMCV